MDFKDRVVIVTGGASGMGEATVEKTAALGARVAILDIDLETAEKVASRLKKNRVEAVAIHMDVTKSDDIKRAVKQAAEVFGKIDVLVNNAGWTKVSSFMAEDEPYWEKLIALNLRGPILMSRAVLPHMIDQKYGKIVNVASEVGRVGIPGQVVYSAAKGGVISFTKSLAREMARHNINVNCVCPGPIDTPLMRSQAEPGVQLDAILKKVSIRRFGRAEEVAHAIAFLASSEADYITGEILSVAGGWAMAG